MAKKGFDSEEAARSAADLANGSKLITNLLPYHYRDPVSGEQKWFLRRTRKKTGKTDNPGQPAKK